MNELKKTFTHPLAMIAMGLLIGGATLKAVGSGNNGIGTLSAAKPAPSRPVGFERSPTGTPAATLEMLDEQFADLAESIEPAVVHIKSKSTGARGQTVMMGEGSGVIYRSDGWIVTNDHVVSGSDKVTVVLSNGKEYEGTVRRSKDIRNDVAVVKIDASGLPAAKFAESKTVRVGQFAVAVGAPFGLENTVTIGHISALGRSSQAGSGMGDVRVYNSMIQTDAPINPGNSGGPLLNIYGEVVGINTSIYAGGAGMMGGQGGNVGIGFAIPSNQAKLIADILITKGKLRRGFLGVEMETLKPYEREQYKMDGGAILRNVPATGPAAKAGLKAGDIITRIGSTEIKSDQDLLNAMLVNEPGSTAMVEYLRDGAKKSTTVTIAEPPKEMTLQEPQWKQAPDSQNPNLKDFFNGESPFGGRSFERFFGDEAPSEPKTEKAPSTPAPKVGEKARLGVQIGDLNEASRSEFSIPASSKGVLVQSVDAGSVAAKLGLKEGDLITEINGNTVDSVNKLMEIMAKAKVGDRGSIAYERYADGVSSQARRSFTF